MNRFLENSQSALRAGGHPDPAAEADRLFPEIVRQSPLHLFAPGDPIPKSGMFILIGVATWSMYDLHLLDVVCSRQSPAVASVFNTAGVTQDQLGRLVPGIGPVFHTPVLGVWRDGQVAEVSSGAAARDRIARMFGFDSDEIIRFVRDQHKN
jgi:hypothetical protein